MPLDSSQQISYFGIQVWDEGTKESWKTFGRSTATRTILCAWTDRVPLINNIFALGGLNNAMQTYYGPAAAYPDAPTLLFLDTLEVEGTFGQGEGLSVGPNGLVAYPYARCRLTFASYPYDQNNLNVTSLDYGVEDISLDPGSSTYYWNSYSSGDKVPPTQVPALRVPSVTISITQYNQVVLPTSAVIAEIGTVNSGTVFGCAAGTLMFAGAKSNRRMTVAGIANYDMSLQFQYLPVGWNNKFRAGTAAWTPIVDSNNNPPFAASSDNFAALGIFSATGNL